MDNQFGHHHHHHHRRDDDDQPPPPPPPSSYEYDDPPPPPHPHPPPHNYGSYSYYDNPPPQPQTHYPDADVIGTHHHHHSSYESQNYPPPAKEEDVDEEPPPPPHQSHHFRPHVPGFIQTHIHTGHVHDYDESSIGGGGGRVDLMNRQSVRVYTKAEEGYSLAIRDGRVILVRSDPNDLSQHWIKDEKYSVKVKDEEGFPTFSLVNKATGQAIKHSVGATQPVQLIPYNPDALDESVLWTLSRDLGDGYRTIRMVNNIRLNFDAYDGNKNRGGVHDGTTIVLWEWKKGENQRWKIVPY